VLRGAATRKVTNVNGESMEIPLSGSRADVSAGRRFVREALQQWGLEELAEDAALVTSELITNAVLHARTAIDVIVRRVQTHVRIEVRDGSRALPRVRSHSVRSGTGRGLQLVSSLSATWGAEVVDAGKIVWVELHTGVDVERGNRAPDTFVVDLDALEAAGGWDDEDDGRGHDARAGLAA
jgi:anti-sigma regulatory factor (Ser/Thr protein kinase)